MVGIPIRQNLTYFDLQITLDGVTYTLVLTLNVRTKSWFMDVLDEQSVTPFLFGLELVTGSAIGAKNTGRSPPGFFVVVDTSGRGEDPGLDGFGARWLLMYLTAQDMKDMGIV